MGAASDHLFAEFITPENAERLDVALRYHQLYAVLIFFIGLYGLNKQYNKTFAWAGYTFSTGTSIFCASLYISLFPECSKVIYLTPLGGIVLMVGWCLTILSIKQFK